MGYNLQVYHDVSREIDFVANNLFRLHTPRLKRRPIRGNLELLQNWTTLVRRSRSQRMILISAQVLYDIFDSGISFRWMSCDKGGCHA